MDAAKTVLDPAGILSGTSTTQSLIDPVGSGIKKLTGSDIASRIADPIGLVKDPELPSNEPARRQLAQANTAISKQAGIESRRVSEEDSEIARKKALMKRGGTGRSLLIRTSPTGTEGAQRLGG